MSMKTYSAIVCVLIFGYTVAIASKVLHEQCVGQSVAGSFAAIVL